MAAKQKKLFGVCVKGIVCLPNLIAEIDTDTHYVYFVRRILSYVPDRPSIPWTLRSILNNFILVSVEYCTSCFVSVVYIALLL